VKKRTVYVVRGDDGEARDLVVGREGETLVVTFAGAVERFGVATLPDGRLSLVFEDGRHVCARGRAGADGFVELSDFRGRRKVAIAEPLRDRMRHAASSAASAASEAEIRALMPGRVVEVKVTPDDRVEPGALLLVLEAMKMQNEIRCDRAGVVDRVEVAAGQSVEGGALMLVLRPPPEQGVEG
jgi:acetyl/propionyl-CoA carboxylase alpha subunit